MPDETMIVSPPPPVNKDDYAPIDPDRTPIDRGDDAEFIVSTYILGGIIATRLYRGDRVTKADIEAGGSKDLKRLVDSGAIVPLRTVDLTPTPVKVEPEKIGKFDNDKTVKKDK